MKLLLLTLLERNPLRTLLLSLVFLLTVGFVRPMEAGWYDTDWQYRKKITVDAAKVPNTDQTNFPCLISRTDSDWKDTTNGGHVAKPNGGDILFTASDGITKLDHEIEEYNPSTGELVAWVEVPTLSASVNTDIYIYYGNADTADQWNIGGTWNEGGNNNLKGIWHLNQATGGTGAILDATSYNNNGTDYGTPAFQTAGQIGYAIDVDGSADYVVVDDDTSLDLVNAFTISGWFYFDTDIGSVRLISKEGVGVWSYRLLTLDNGIFGFEDGLLIQLSSNGSSNSLAVQINYALTLFKNEWVFLTATYNGSTLRLYVNATDIGSNNGSISIYNSDVRFGIGASGEGGWPLNGLIDEVRVSNIARSADWIATCYNNQNFPSTFYSVGVEETEPLPIQLAYFTGSVVPNSNGVQVNWGTITETNNYGFYVQQSVNTTSSFVDLPNSFVPGQGTTLIPHDYSWTHQSVAQGTYYYRLKQIDLDGTTNYTDAVQITVDGVTGVDDKTVPEVFSLDQNYPNPFNPSTTIRFTVETKGHTTLTVFNALGQEIATLFSGEAESGQVYTTNFDGTNLANGMYFYKLVSNDQSSIKKLVLLK